MTIPPQQFAFGVHSITLVVQDKDGLVASNTFDLEVGDTTAPSLSIPPDVTTPFYPPGTGSVYVPIGEASASDGCSVKADTLVSNDAPANLLFPPGVTTVTWTADDGRGNLTSAKQKVTVNAIALLEVVFVAVFFVAILVGVYWLRSIKRRN